MKSSTVLMLSYENYLPLSYFHYVFIIKVRLDNAFLVEISGEKLKLKNEKEETSQDTCWIFNQWSPSLVRTAV